ncbi:hypothetical protein GCM10011611_33470 [Aliidongia dinghuensis]|uniref:DUF1109 domain-containing protein n=2 Tax=Aliidongia dinghuensis TaxID=1867774 RepID=A0A8J3E468_9PROT|nr:hypothetical protein GCM10011611_33470 [Aliidongia dinghuensis]
MRWLLPIAVLSLGVAIALVFLLFGVSAQLPGTVQGAPFLHKVASALALAAGGFLLARDAVRPGGEEWGNGWGSGRWLPALLPGAALLLIGGVTDESGLSSFGRSDVSVPICVGAIVLVSLPALGLILAALRSGAATRPGRAGAAAGLLAGALGAAAYALACKNDGGLFVAIWYTTAIALVAGLGAVVGRRTLAW